MGFAYYFNNDSFASCLFSNLVTLSTFMPVFRREYRAGIYSPTVFYVGMWLTKVCTVGFYPNLIQILMYRNLSIKDQSVESFSKLMVAGFLQSINGVTLGHMWSSFFDCESTVLLSGFCIMQTFSLGAVQSVAGTKSIMSQALRFISPLSYTLEQYLRRLLDGHVA